MRTAYLTLAVTLLCASAYAQPDAAGSAPVRPIVAVFDIEAREGAIKPETLSILTDYLAARLGASSRLRIVPRSQVKQRLSQMKATSYKDCYDQSCQIELGRELAANKSLAAQILKVEQQCVLTLELFDLKQVATDAAATARGPCADDMLFHTVGQAVDSLVAGMETVSPSSAPAPPQVSLYVTTEPSGAQIMVNGLYRDTTPAHVSVPLGRPVKLTLMLEGHVTQERRLDAREAQRVDVDLPLTDAGRRNLATTSEWFGLGLGPGYMRRAASTMLGINFRMATIKWYRLFWTLFDISGQLSFGASESPTTDEPASALTLSTRAGYPLYLGARGQHQFLFGVGVGYTMLSVGPAWTTAQGTTERETRSLFTLSPGVDYAYNLMDGAFPVGLGVRLNLPVAGDLDGDYPISMMATINVGFSLYRLLVGSKSSATRPRPIKSRK